MEAVIPPAAAIHPARRMADALVALLLWLLLLGPFLHAHAGPASARGWHLPESRMAGAPVPSTVETGWAATDSRGLLSALPAPAAPSPEPEVSPAGGERLPMSRPAPGHPAGDADAMRHRIAALDLRPGSTHRRPPPQGPPARA